MQRYILGLNLGHDPSAALLDYQGNILAGAHEARLTRNKKERRFPDRAIDSVLQTAAIAASNIDVVSFTNYEADTLKNIRDKYLCGEGSLNDTPEGLITSKLRSHGLSNFKLERQEHHFCHACTAYYATDDPQALVVTCDGFGDGVSLTVRRPVEGRLTPQPLYSLPLHASLGLPYQYVTGGLGFSMLSEEWKILGLEQVGNPEAVRSLFEDLFVEKDGKLVWNYDKLAWAMSVDGVSKASDDLMKAMHRYMECFVPKFKAEDVSAGVQDLLEKVLVAQLNKFASAVPVSLALAGGTFLNVKLNRVLGELDWVKSVSVFPAAGDGGNAVGAALAHLHQQSNPPSCGQLKDVFWGQDYRDIVPKVCASFDLVAPKLTDDEAIAQIADAVAQGRVVAVVRGRSEFGPRALLHRSLICRMDRSELTSQLNKWLFRDKFMPYGCSILETEAKRYLQQAEPLLNCMRYMIAAPKVSEEFYSRYASVCHPVRGGGVSTRPQVVNADNSWEARLLKAIGERTGFAGVLNTSFNLHGEPIVETPEDALISFKTAAIPESLLFLEDRLLSINAVAAAAIPTLKLPHAKSVPRRRREACVCVVSPDGQYAVPQVRDDILSFGYAITSEYTTVLSRDVCEKSGLLDINAADNDRISHSLSHVMLVVGNHVTEVMQTWASSRGNGWQHVRAADNGMETCLRLQHLFPEASRDSQGIYADLMIWADNADMNEIVTVLARTALTLAGLLLPVSKLTSIEKLGACMNKPPIALIFGTAVSVPEPLGGTMYMYSPDGLQSLGRRVKQLAKAIEERDFLACRTGGLVLVYHPDSLAPLDEDRVIEAIANWGVDGIVVAAPGITQQRGRTLNALAKKHGLSLLGGSDAFVENAGTIGVQSGGLGRFINRFPGLEV